jgi:hypothetical protein
MSKVLCKAIATCECDELLPPFGDVCECCRVKLSGCGSESYWSTDDDSVCVTVAKEDSHCNYSAKFSISIQRLAGE